jgi:hypothetical protein
LFTYSLGSNGWFHPLALAHALDINGGGIVEDEAVYSKKKTKKDKFFEMADLWKNTDWSSEVTKEVYRWMLHVRHTP